MYCVCVSLVVCCCLFVDCCWLFSTFSAYVVFFACWVGCVVVDVVDVGADWFLVRCTLTLYVCAGCFLCGFVVVVVVVRAGLFLILCTFMLSVCFC